MTKTDSHKNIPRQYSFVVFDTESTSKEIYEMNYEKVFPKWKLFIFLGEVPNAKGHCILADLNTGKVIGMYHTINFREAFEDEI